ncbi:hypothetical protein E2P81_ATG09026 [Venturia nashicola]|nr:hypothetical protein E2P81_ATG09026 [Venturia nashicola]
MGCMNDEAQYRVSADCDLQDGDNESISLSHCTSRGSPAEPPVLILSRLQLLPPTQAATSTSTSTSTSTTSDLLPPTSCLPPTARFLLRGIVATRATLSWTSTPSHTSSVDGVPPGSIGTTG